MTSPLALRSEWWLRFFDRAFTHRFARSFVALRLARWGEPEAAPGRPLILLANHPGWWDGVLTMLVTRRLLPERRGFVPMDAAALKKYGFMRRIGVFGVEQDSPRGVVQFLDTARQVLADPSHLLWVNAPGRFADVRERPAPIAPGMTRLPEIAPDAVLLPLAIEYAHWTEARGEALIAFGAPMAAKDLLALPRPAREDAMRAAMEATMDRLAQDAIARDPDRFRTVLAGGRGMGGIYGAWQRLRFAPEHDARARPG
ncbi:lysophospholipid acyltransferase family protein [Roseococcus sp. YIM B11640]|uniref:lysophospholipid acyltransferase family protein n=1 Tax=Roseococcus sp. YIM B11640 TaxID=3133973 RepID=UPI003C7AB031